MISPPHGYICKHQTAPEQATGAGLLTPPPISLLPKYPAALIACEIEAPRLVAQGLTNKEAAERLIIGPHTVNMRVRSIFGKLEVSSRADATRYAVEHDLV